MPKPNGVMNSAFDVGATPPPRRASPTRLDVSTVRIESGVPLPERDAPTSPYQTLVDRMEPDSMVRLSRRHATGLVSRLKALGLPHARRRLGEDQVGVWRLAKPEENPPTPRGRKPGAGKTKAK